MGYDNNLGIGFVNRFNRDEMNSNALIAEYMDIPKCDRCDVCDSYKFGSGIYFDPLDMQYDTSFDWLIPVAIKCIESLGDIYWSNSNNDTEQKAKEFKGNIIRNPFDIKSLYKHVIESIQFINTQKLEKLQQYNLL